MIGTSRSWPLSSVLLALVSAIILGVGIYFMVFRPPLLPEDVRYMHLTATELATMEPRLAPWLSQIFRVLGGYAAATGLLGIALAATSFRTRHPGALVGAFAAGLASIGLMAAVNVAIDSHYKLPLIVLAALWFTALITFVLEGARPRSPQPPS
jgi:hypothetical protein